MAKCVICNGDITRLQREQDELWERHKKLEALRDHYLKALEEIVNHYGVTPYEEGISPLSIATEAIGGA